MLTDTAVREAIPSDKVYKLADAGGLYHFVMTSGGRTRRYRYRCAGKEQRLVFWACPEVTLKTARDPDRDEEAVPFFAISSAPTHGGFMRNTSSARPCSRNIVRADHPEVR